MCRHPKDMVEITCKYVLLVLARAKGWGLCIESKPSSTTDILNMKQNAEDALFAS